MDVAAWLHDLGLEQYAEAFLANDIDAGVFCDLTAEDLIGLGVTSFGHRRRLRAAIRALNDPPPPALNSQRPVLGTSSRAESERRQLTVVFVDRVGSTALPSSLDPEEMADLLRRYQEAVAHAITRFEGHVAKYMGDGVLAYFGYPRVHEDEPERSVRAGLAAVEAVGVLRTAHGEPLAARVGIGTGPVVVGELIGEGTAREETVVGDTPYLAARLQTLAEPATVVIGPRTRKLIGELFDLADLGTHVLKGFPVPVRAWRVLGESRFEALHGTGLTPLVGREHEVGLLLERWERARKGEGQVVVLSGEPDIGKSRLIRALRARLGAEPHTVLGQYCSPHHQTSPLHPVIGLLEQAAGFTPSDTREAKLEKLEALLAPSTDQVPEAAALPARLLSLDPGDRYPQLDLSPHRQKERTLEVLVEQLPSLAARRPVLVLYEDVHWADPTPLELLHLVVHRVQRCPVLVLITFRPEFVPPWTRYGHVTSLTLSRLSRRQSAAMVERLAGGKALPTEVLNQIVAKTDGVPLFVKELTRTVMDTNLLTDEGDHYAFAGSPPSLELRVTSLMSSCAKPRIIRRLAQLSRLCVSAERSRRWLSMTQSGTTSWPTFMSRIRA